MNIIHSGPPVAQDAFHLPQPTEACPRSLRKAVEAQIERLIAFLDCIDIDSDREEDGADPSDHAIRHYATGGWTQGEDNEPSIGWAEAESLNGAESHVGGFGYVDGELDRCDDENGHDCQRRRDFTAAGRSKSAARTQARRPPIGGLLACRVSFLRGRVRRRF